MPVPDEDIRKTLSPERFLQLMKSPAAIPMVADLKRFIAGYQGRQGSSPGSKQFQDKMAVVESTLNNDKAWANCPPEDLANVLEGYESYFTTKLYADLFGGPEDAAADSMLSLRLSALQGIEFKHLEISQEYERNSPLISLAVNELQKMNEFKSPRDKLRCLCSCCLAVQTISSEPTRNGAGGGGADAFTPLFLYVLITAQPHALQSTVNFIDRYRYHKRLSMGEVGYFYTQLVGAVNFLTCLTPDSLAMERDEFIARMLQVGLEDCLMAPSAAPSAAPPAAPAAGRVPSPTPQSAAPELPPLEQLQARGTPGLLAASTAGTLQQQHPFVYADAHDLTIGEVQELLTAYKELVLQHVSVCAGYDDLRAGGSGQLLSLPSTTPGGASSVDLLALDTPPTVVESSGGEDGGGLRPPVRSQGLAQQSPDTDEAAEASGASAAEAAGGPSEASAQAAEQGGEHTVPTTADAGGAAGVSLLSGLKVVDASQQQQQQQPATSANAPATQQSLLDEDVAVPPEVPPVAAGDAPAKQVSLLDEDLAVPPMNLTE